MKTIYSRHLTRKERSALKRTMTTTSDDIDLLRTLISRELAGGEPDLDKVVNAVDAITRATLAQARAKLQANGELQAALIAALDQIEDEIT